MDAEPGAISVLPPGYKFESWNPDYPHQNYESFVKATLRTVASGLGIAYHTLANDLAEVNYSSSRAGTIEERDNWIVQQNWFADSFLRVIYDDWLTEALKRGAITMPMGSALPAAKQAKWAVHQWQGRRWQWVDPMKDIEAARLAIKTGIASPQMIAAQNGVDIEDVLQSIATFEARVTESGVTLVDFELSTPGPAEPPPVPQMSPDAARQITELQTSLRNLEEVSARRADAMDKAIKENSASALRAIQTMLEREPVAPNLVVNNYPPPVNVENNVQPTPVQVAAPNVEVHVEAIMPDHDGNVTRSEQIESDLSDEAETQ